ncbi:unnamed protein product, partial [Mesorhabditis spiculigera]
MKKVSGRLSTPWPRNESELSSDTSGASRDSPDPKLFGGVLSDQSYVGAANRLWNDSEPADGSLRLLDSTSSPVEPAPNTSKPSEAVFRKGDPTHIRRSLVAAKKATQILDARFLKDLKSAAKSELGLHEARRLRKGLIHILSEWSHLAASSKLTLNILMAHVTTLEIFRVCQAEDTLPELRKRVDYLLEHIESDCLNGTRLADLLHLASRSLRNEARRDKSKELYQRAIK